MKLQTQISSEHTLILGEIPAHNKTTSSLYKLAYSILLDTYSRLFLSQKFFFSSFGFGFWSDGHEEEWVKLRTAFLKANHEVDLEKFPP